MKEHIFLPLAFAFILTCSCTQSQKSQVTYTPGDVTLVSFDQLASRLEPKTDETVVINFWATWCAPCVAELPIFESFAKENPNAKVLLVSMDFPKDVETKLKPFLKKRGIVSEVLLLDESNANSWINKIDSQWSGALPFTVILNKGKKSGHERQFESIKDLVETIQKTQ